MHTRTTFKNWAVASAVAAMLAAAPSAFAQDASAPAGTTPPATTSPSTTPDASTMPAPAAGSAPSAPSSSSTGSTAPAPMMSPDTSSSAVPANFPTDYGILNNRYFDAVDLEQARARGLSESQIATIVKITKETGYPFKYISSQVERGTTFPSLATEYGLKLNDVYENQKEMQQISDYTTLHKSAESLGKSDMMSMPMSSSSMPMDNSTTPSSSTASTPPMSSSASAPASTPTLDIVDTAMAAKNLTTLVKALQIAGLVETLKGSGPFTVFAPTDRAFAKLPAGALDALEADPAKLKTVLTYHVIPAAVSSADAMNMTSPTSPPTVEGATLQITKGRRGRLKVNNATVVKADIQASNGVIHIIDAVLMPPDASAATSPTPDTTTTPSATPTDATPPTAPATPGTATPAAPDAATPPAAPGAAQPNADMQPTAPVPPTGVASPGQ